jgi:hypothetical protein
MPNAGPNKLSSNSLDLRIKKLTCMRSRSAYSTSLCVAIVCLASCTYNDIPRPVDCNVESTINPTNCHATDGSITVSAAGGQAPYRFSLNGGAFQASNSFTGLGPGSYLIKVKEVQQCEASAKAILIPPNSTLATSFSVTNDTDCLVPNGSIHITASLGKPPYKFQFGQGSLKNSVSGDTIFNNLKSGTYTIRVEDSDGCPTATDIIVPKGNTGVSYAGAIKPILDANCNLKGCHNSDLGSTRDWRNYNNVKTNAAIIKSRTTDRSPTANRPDCLLGGRWCREQLIANLFCQKNKIENAIQILRAGGSIGCLRQGT